MKFRSPNCRLLAEIESAFTLIELLTVIVVVIVLAALLLTAIYQSKAKALRIQCANNLRQQGISLQEFKLDNSFYPPQLDPNNYSEGRYWEGALAYEMNIKGTIALASKNIWNCPAAPRPTSSDWESHPEWVYEDYGYNAFGLGSYAFTNSFGLSEYWRNEQNEIIPVARVKESQVVNPADMYAIGDSFFGCPAGIKDGESFIGRASQNMVLSTSSEENLSVATKRSYARHQGCANVVFCDGHVESPTLKFLFVDTNDAALIRWNRDHQPHRENL